MITIYWLVAQILDDPKRLELRRHKNVQLFEISKQGMQHKYIRKITIFTVF